MPVEEEEAAWMGDGAGVAVAVLAPLTEMGARPPIEMEMKGREIVDNEDLKGYMRPVALTDPIAYCHKD